MLSVINLIIYKSERFLRLILSCHYMSLALYLLLQIVVSSQKMLILRLNQNSMDGTDGQNSSIFLPYSGEGNCYGDFVYPFDGQP